MSKDLRVRLGLFDTEDNFYGYKTDTFWSLSKEKEHAKKHGADKNSHLIDNLIRMLNQSEEKIDIDSDGIGALFKFIGNQFLKTTEQMRNTNTLYVKVMDWNTNLTLNTIKIFRNKRNKWTWERQEDLI